MSFKLGLTGSIGMGKSTTAQMFADSGYDVWDADAAVHRLYAPNGLAIAPIAELVLEAVRENVLDRGILREAIRADETLLSRIEKIVHPMVSEDQKRFIRESNKKIIVFEIPILFETAGNKAMDAVACVSVDSETQKRRVMARGTMLEEDFNMILSRQMPIEKKRALSDYVIETNTLEHAQTQVLAIIEDIKGKLAHA